MSSREQIKQYLLAKGIPELQVQGILLNIEDESGFSANPSGPNDAGNSYGLFQHNGPRKRGLFKHAGSSSPSWQQQVDYALTEPDMASYLQGSYSNVGDAAVGFLDRFERPAKKHRDARAAKYRSQYGHWSPSGGAVDMATVTPGPAYQNQGAVAPVDMGGIPTRDPYQSAGAQPMQGNDDISRALARLEQIRNGLAAPPQAAPVDPWAMLGNLGAGILGAGGGPGAGNWFGAGLQYAQQQIPQAPPPLSALDHLQAEGELARMRADLMQKQAQRKYRDSLSPEMQVLHDAAGGSVMAKAEMNELLKQKFGSGPEGTAKVQNYRYLTEELGVPPEEAQEMVFKSSGVQVNVGDGGSQYGSIPAGYSRTIDPVTGAATDMPNPGTKPYVEQQAKEQSINAAFQGIEQMETFIRGKGEGLDLSSEDRQRGEQLHNEMIGVLRDLNVSGTLDENEYVRFNALAPNPGERFTVKDAKDMLASYDEMRRRLQRKTGRAAPEINDDPMDLGL